MHSERKAEKGYEKGYEVGNTLRRYFKEVNSRKKEECYSLNDIE